MTEKMQKRKGRIYVKKAIVYTGGHILRFPLLDGHVWGGGGDWAEGYSLRPCAGDFLFGLPGQG